MKLCVQRVLESSCIIDGKTVSKIDQGLLILVGFTENDNLETVKKAALKIKKLRIFEDDNQKMNLSITDVNGQILSVSQFTLYGDVTKGNRPSFTKSLNPQEANILYDEFNKELAHLGLDVKTGVFGADMKIHLINDGPVTLIIDF